MADLSVTPVSTQITPVRQMSLADIMNMASGAQAYHQAQQLNPVQLEAARLELQQKQALNPLLQRQQQAVTSLAEQTLQPGIRQAEAQAQSAQTQADTAKLKLSGDQRQAALDVIGAYAQHPVWKSNDPVKTRDTIADIQQELIKRGLTPGQALDQVTTLMYASKQGGDAIQNVMQTALKGAVSPETRLSQATPQLVTGPNGTPALYTSGTGQISQPTYQGQPAPAQGMPATTTPAMPAAATPQALPYPATPIGSIPNRSVTVNEQADMVQGQKYRTQLIDQQSSVNQSQFNLDQVIKEATKLQESALPTSGIAGAVRRKVAGWAGDPTYIQLGKDLANVEISNIRALGGSLDTVAGQQLMRMASGDETYPPDVLINIANRAKANLTNIDLQAQATQKFAQRYGDQNINAFKQAWSSNTDPKLFQAINIVNTEQNPALKKKKLTELLGTNPSDLKKFDQMYENTMKMVNTGELPR